jgi:uncharacterized protein with von Willebrand factor type A (vWA) domain
VPLLDRHVAFVEALRTAGLPVSLSEDLDGVRAVTMLGLEDREDVRAALAATLVKRQSHRQSFDAVFDLFFPALLGSGSSSDRAQATARPDASRGSDVRESRFGGEGELRDGLVEAMAGEDQEGLVQLVRESVERFGAMPGRPRGMSSWSSYNTLQKLSPDTLVLRLAEALMRGSDDREPRSEELAMLGATRRVDAMRRMVETDVRRRIAEEKDPDYVARTTLRPSLDQVPFVNARRADVDEMRRQVYPLARRLAARLAREQHARRRGPLDFRRTVRASVSTGGVPLVTHHRPRRPHRPELVVLCDVSGSVANFASFTLLLVYALREQFGKVRAFTFVDDVHEVTDEFVPGADLEDTLTRLAASARHASQFGRTSYGRAFQQFVEKHPDALGPRTSLLILGDARSNYTDPQLPLLRSMVDASRHAWWLNPESRGQWDTGDSAAREYGEIVPMVECRNLTQLTELVHDLV